MTRSTERPVDDVAYIATVRRELAPEWLRFAVTLNGYDVARPASERSWCELGCGHAITSAIVAARDPIARCVAIDANPEHINRAAAFVARAGIENLQLLALDFAAALETAEREQWQPFDYIVAHGVYSWVAPDIQAQMRTFIDRHLAPGGIVYLSYNTMPGWQAELPFQYLVKRLADGATGNSSERFSGAMHQVIAMRDAGAPSLREVSGLRRWESDTAKQLSGYFPHEYLVPSWKPRYVDEIWHELAEVALTPSGSATIVENIDDFALTRSARDLLATVDPAQRELMRDFLLHRRFRQDTFMREPRRLSAGERRERLLAYRFALVTPVERITYVMETTAGVVRFDNPVARQIVAALAREAGVPRAIVDASISDQDLLANVLTLAASNLIEPVTAVDASYAPLNAALAEQLASDDARTVVLRSGAAIHVSRTVVEAWRNGSPTPVDKQDIVRFLDQLA